MIQTPRFTDFGRARGAPLRVLCFPCAGAGASMYREWAGALHGADVYAAQLPGRERRIGERAIDVMDTMMGELLPAVQSLASRPFILFGHSMGALIAYELACRLQAGGGPVPSRVFVSAYRSPERPNPNKELHGLDDRAFMAEIRRYGGTPEAVLAHEDIMALLLPTLRADFKLHETYRCRPVSALSCPIDALAGSRDAIVSAEQMSDWRLRTVASFELREVEGEHFFVNEARQQVLQLVQRRIDQTAPHALSRVA